MSPNRDCLTEAEVKVLIANELKPYHEQNTRKFEDLFAALNRLTGSIKTSAWILGFILSMAGLFIALYKR